MNEQICIECGTHKVHVDQVVKNTLEFINEIFLINTNDE